MSNDCQSCGACCAHFRVSFYWGETDSALGGTVPTLLTIPIHSIYVAMRGTDQHPSHCVALRGKVGEQVSCGIYEQRSSTCKEVIAGDEQCNKARRAYNLGPIINPPQEEAEILC
jgi:Fe-S-cluster containining protein